MMDMKTALGDKYVVKWWNSSRDFSMSWNRGAFMMHGQTMDMETDDTLWHIFAYKKDS